MSLSRILKSGCSRSAEGFDFSLASFEGALQYEVFDPSADFTPLFADLPELESEYESVEGDAGMSADPRSGADHDASLLKIEEEELNCRLEEAFENGLVEGRRQGEEELASVARTLEEALTEVSRLRERILRECEDDLLKLALMVSRKIIQQEVTHDRRILAQFIGEALRSVEKQEDIVICLSPEDCRVVTANKGFYLGSLDEGGRVTIKADEGTPPGGCIVETSNGIVDARIEAQLDSVYRRLVEERCTLTMVSGLHHPEALEVMTEVVSP